MQANKTCPACGTVNENLNLQETDGLYICCQCQALVDTKVEQEKSAKQSKLGRNKKYD